jgi:hypothetical protein
MSAFELLKHRFKKRETMGGRELGLAVCRTHEKGGGVQEQGGQSLCADKELEGATAVTRDFSREREQSLLRFLCLLLPESNDGRTLVLADNLEQSLATRTKSLKEQRQYLPAFASREALLKIVRENQGASVVRFFHVFGKLRVRVLATVVLVRPAG